MKGGYLMNYMDTYELQAMAGSAASALSSVISYIIAFALSSVILTYAIR